MEQIQIISGENEEVIWQQVEDSLDGDAILDYQAILDENGMQVELEVDIDPGGGFESGYEFTRFSSGIMVNNDFRFAIHHEGFIDKLGKFVGMEDVIIGYPEFDKKLIVKTNDAAKVKNIFADSSLRNFFQSLTDFTLHITHRHTDKKEKITALELEIQKGITDLPELRKIYHVFIMLLISIANSSTLN